VIPIRPTPAPTPPTPMTLSKVLQVEGDTPMHFFEALLRHLGLSAVIEIRNFRGVSDFKDYLSALVSTPDFQSLVTSVGVVRDAEDKPAVDARQSVTDAFTAAGLTHARTPPVRTAAFILPDDANPGMIETLCMEAVRQEATLADALCCVEDFFLCLDRKKVALPAPPIRAKNHAQAYLGTRPEAQMFPGIAAYRGYWPWDSPAFGPLKLFLTNL
jgi:hypothetical protein